VELTEILRCPKTGNKLQFEQPSSTLLVEHSDVTYPITDGIVDFCPQSHDRISASYNKVASRYDPYITASSISAKIISRIIWGRQSDRDTMQEVLSLLPSRFDGVLLDVPVGTAVFTIPLYRRYSKATIIGVDSSMNMLRKAKMRLQEQGVNNVHLLKADAANLPIRDAAVDIVLSMNGWHAFADKRHTTAEMKRVLRKDGRLIACGYVKGDRWLSDWFIRHFGVRNGFFTPPFFTFDELVSQFQDFTIERKDSDKSIGWFEAVNEATRT